jgi:hypothetical protein
MRVVAYRPQATVTVACSNSGAEQLNKLIEYIKTNGNTGHSFSIIVDPESETEEKFFWDGDGSDSIGDITVEQLDSDQ